MKHLEKLYALIFNTATYGIIVSDDQHHLLTANAHFCKITGYCKEELEGQSVFSLFPPKIQPKVAEMYVDVTKGIAHPERIIKVYSKDGHLLLLSLTLQYVQEGDDSYFINSFKSVDASDRYVNLFQETEKAAKIGGWEIDLISRQPLITDAFRNIYDIEQGVQITIEESLSFYPPAYRSALNQALECASKEGKSSTLKLQLISAKGKAKWVKITCNPLTVEGRTVKLYGTIQDISEEKNRHEFLRLLIDTIPNLILVKDKNGRFVLVNKAYARFYNKVPEDMVGKTNQELGLHNAEMIEKFDAEDQAIFQGEKPYIVLEEKAIRPDGTACWFKTVKTAVVSEDGSIEQVLIIATDITERKKTEQKQKSALRKEKILNESLIKINAEMDQFVYSASHNLRAPLTSMLGVVHILKTEESIEDQAKMVQLIEKSIYQLDATIQEITDYARNNRVEVVVAPIDFEKIISDTIDSLKFIESAGQIKIHYEIEEALNFSSDDRRLKVIFNNLLSNAIKYQNPNTLQQRIDLFVKREGKYIMVKVQDNGIGIRLDQQRKIFNMFHRGTDRSSGAGLGLYIVKETLDKLKGSIKVDSIYGEGSTFTLKIPRIRGRL